MGTVFHTAKKLGGSLYLDSGCLVDCKRPEFFLSPDSTKLDLVSLKGSEVEAVIFKDSNPIPYSIVGDSLEFETQPTTPLMVVPIKNLGITQFLRKTIPTEVFFKIEQDQNINNLVIASINFLTDLPGPIQFATSKTGEYLNSLTLPEGSELWIKGVETSAQSSMTTYISITGEIYL